MIRIHIAKVVHDVDVIQHSTAHVRTCLYNYSTSHNYVFTGICNYGLVVSDFVMETTQDVLDHEIYSPVL